ncbi:MAG: DUF1127 domain-containing protein [Rhizobiaceae bacterium]|nr:DUF1127 domain-containing protein [Rhizobiaceae bacterium]
MSTIDTYRDTLREHELPAARTPSSRFSVVRFLEWVEMRLERRRSRIALLEMTDQQLADIGVSRAEAYREGSRSVWY